MKGHVFLQNGRVSSPQRHGALAPIRRVAHADGVAGAIVFCNAIFLEDIKKCAGNILTSIADPRLFQPSLHTFQNRLFRI